MINSLDPQDQFSDDVISRLSIWSVNSDGISMQYSLTESHLTYSDKGWNGMVVFVVDYSQPWSLMERLENWVDVLEKHLGSIKVIKVLELCVAFFWQWVFNFAADFAYCLFFQFLAVVQIIFMYFFMLYGHFNGLICFIFLYPQSTPFLCFNCLIIL